MIFFAYLLVVLGGPVVFTITVLLLGFLLALLLAWAQITFRVAIASSIAGLLGTFAVSAFGLWAFSAIAAIPANSAHPLVAIAVALLIPLVNDLGKARQLRAAASKLPPGLEDEAVSAHIGLPAQALGSVVGFVALLGWLALGGAA